jgi:hypothetical protein
MSVFPIFIKSSSNLIALTSVSVYIEDVKEKNQIPLYVKIKVPTMKSPLNLVKSLLAVASVAALSAISAAPAWAFNFSNITGGDTHGDAYVNSFTFDVFNQGSEVIFNITNSGDAAAPNMFISKVLFDDNDGYLSAPSVKVSNNGEVAFRGGPGKDQLPQGGKGFTTDYAFSRKTGEGNAFGIQGDESLAVKFTGNYNNVMYALNSGALKLGLHVQALPNGQSDSYISSSRNTQNTPEPLTMLAAGAAVGFGTMFKKQRAQAQKAE